MDRDNTTTINYFFLSDLSESPEIQHLLFCMFLIIYIISILGNASIIFAYTFSSDLQTPMYFCLINFSFVEMCYISTTVPNLLLCLITGDKRISFYGCATQVYSFSCFGVTECFILAAMAYDRYNAICNPLLYNTIMNKRTCVILIVGSWLIASINSLIHTILTFMLPFCGSNAIDSFFCDMPPLLKLACTDTLVNQIVIFVTGSCIIAGPFILTVFSYVQIISTIVSIRSSSKKKKAFSTCTSHITAVVIFYVPSICIYFRPKSNQAMIQDKMATVIYAVITPLLNPFIYSLRNHNVKVAVKKMIHKLSVQF
ncbi:olfactory receptor 1361 [Xenopus laevis]|uniref:Olfactory receptor n=2 Tax=Xenopus laevis TaxID=8355 RepID=A0A974HCD1_XENLA|nr:olfactory receptor 1361 [Xenopus laevis]OCT72737.1 hypothetical protein XELAEV_18035720mg [Xenopus laevis]